MSAQDKVALSVRERQELAHLHSVLEGADPGLARLLAGAQGGLPPAGRLALAAARLAGLLARRLWAGPVVVVLGLGLMMAGLASSVGLSLPGALLTTAGLGLSFHALKLRSEARPPRVPAGPRG